MKNLTIASLITIGLTLTACHNTTRSAYYPRDVLGVIEYEYDGNFSQDNSYDGEIMTILKFGEDNHGFKRGDVYGYYETADLDNLNYWFKFIPEGRYNLEAQLWDGDLFISQESERFFHADDEDTYVDMYIWPGGGTTEISSKISTGKVSTTIPTMENKFYVSEKAYDLMQQNITEPEDMENFKNNVVKTSNLEKQIELSSQKIERER